MSNILNKIQKLGNALIHSNEKGLDVACHEVTDKTDISEVVSGYCLAVGGKENILEVDACITRLRLTLKDISVVDEVACMQLGAAGLIKCNHNNLQIVVGVLAELISEEMKKAINK